MISRVHGAAQVQGACADQHLRHSHSSGLGSYNFCEFELLDGQVESSNPPVKTVSETVEARLNFRTANKDPSNDSACESAQLVRCCPTPQVTPFSPYTGLVCSDIEGAQTGPPPGERDGTTCCAGCAMLAARGVGLPES